MHTWRAVSKSLPSLIANIQEILSWETSPARHNYILGRGWHLIPGIMIKPWGFLSGQALIVRLMVPAHAMKTSQMRSHFLAADDFFIWVQPPQMF